MPRQARLDAPGTLHHVIVRGIERGKIVRDRWDREEFVRRLGETAVDTGTVVYAWTVLGNHAHILVRSGPELVSGFMRRLLTRYAVYFNRRHGRHGHVFQNRYKSIVCDEDAYFTELVRYIHLNPLRAGMVRGMEKLDGYRYCGHSCIMGRLTRGWQDRDYVLRWFGSRERSAIRAYREFVEAGIAQGRRPDLVGGGLIRSLGGWSEVISMRRRQERCLTDERVLGTGEFVERLLAEADERVRSLLSPVQQDELILRTMETVCTERGIERAELCNGGKRRPVAAARHEIAGILAKEHGVPLAAIARHVGVTTSGVWRILYGTRQKSK
jgi:putative transposase